MLFGRQPRRPRCHCSACVPLLCEQCEPPTIRADSASCRPCPAGRPVRSPAQAALAGGGPLTLSARQQGLEPRHQPALEDPLDFLAGAAGAPRPRPGPRDRQPRRSRTAHVAPDGSSRAPSLAPTPPARASPPGAEAVTLTRAPSGASDQLSAGARRGRFPGLSKPLVAQDINARIPGCWTQVRPGLTLSARPKRRTPPPRVFRLFPLLRARSAGYILRVMSGCACRGPRLCRVPRASRKEPGNRRTFRRRSCGRQGKQPCGPAPAPPSSRRHVADEQQARASKHTAADGE